MKPPPKRPKRSTVAVFLRLPPEVRDQLAQLAQRLGLSASETVQHLIQKETPTP